MVRSKICQFTLLHYISKSLYVQFHISTTIYETELPLCNSPGWMHLMHLKTWLTFISNIISLQSAHSLSPLSQADAADFTTWCNSTQSSTRNDTKFLLINFRFVIVLEFLSAPLRWYWKSYLIPSERVMVLGALLPVLSNIRTKDTWNLPALRCFILCNVCILPPTVTCSPPTWSIF